MKIIILGTAWPFRGGLAAYNERLARQLADEGHHVQIITFSLQYPSFLFPGKTQYSDQPAPEGISIRPMVNSINPFNWVITGLRIRKMNPDLVLVKFWLPFMAPCLGTIARITCLKRNARCISIVDNIIPHEKRPGDRFLSKYFTGSVHGFITMSDNVLSDLKQFTRKPSVFAFHPLYDNFGSILTREKALEELGLSAEYRYILFFGIIRHYKGLDLLLEAFAGKRFETLPVKLMVAGEYYEDKKPYTDLIENKQLYDRLVVHDFFIPDNRVNLYFCACDIVAQPYRSATQSGVTQIAYHFEKPMLVTNTGGLAEIVPHQKCGYVVAPEPGSIGDALFDFFDNQRSEQFTEGIKTEKQKFGWDKMTQTIYRLYQQIQKK